MNEMSTKLKESVTKLFLSGGACRSCRIRAVVSGFDSALSACSCHRRKPLLAQQVSKRSNCGKACEKVAKVPPIPSSKSMMR